MKYLLYGIVRQDLTWRPPVPGLTALAAHGLAAVLSPVEGLGSEPTLSTLLAYEKVVESIHAGQPVIPMRYGCVMESESAVLRLLEPSAIIAARKVGHLLH